MKLMELPNVKRLFNRRVKTSKATLNEVGAPGIDGEVVGMCCAVDTRPHKGGKDGIWLGIKPDQDFYDKRPAYVGLVYALLEDVELA